MLNSGGKKLYIKVSIIFILCLGSSELEYIMIAVS